MEQDKKRTKDPVRLPDSFATNTDKWKDTERIVKDIYNFKKYIYFVMNS